MKPQGRNVCVIFMISIKQQTLSWTFPSLSFFRDVHQWGTCTLCLLLDRVRRPCGGLEKFFPPVPQRCCGCSFDAEEIFHISHGINLHRVSNIQWTPYWPAPRSIHEGMDWMAKSVNDEVCAQTPLVCLFGTCHDS